MKKLRLDGVGDEVQVGKTGPFIKKVDASTIQILNPAQSGFAILRVGDPVDDNDLLNKKWALDTLADGGFNTPTIYLSDTTGTDVYTLPDATADMVGVTYVVMKLSPQQIDKIFRVKAFTGQKIGYSNNIIEEPGYIEIRNPYFPVYLTVVEAGVWGVTSMCELTKENISLVGRDSFVVKAVRPNATGAAVPSSNMNGYGFAFGGFSTLLNDRYNDSTNAWTSRTTGPTTSGYGRTAGSGFALNGKAYVVSGGDNNNLNSQYIDEIDFWVAKAVGNIANISHGLTLNGFGYKVMGADGLGATVYPMHQYSDSTNAWVNKANAATGGNRQVGATTLNGYAYYSTGFSASAFNITEKYNDSANTWIIRTANPQTIYGTCLFTLNGFMNSVYGNTSPGTTLANNQYNDFLNSWTAKTNGLTARFYCGRWSDYNGYGYVVQGTSGVGNVLEQYN